ncbi:hypothetical protein GQ55_8G036000 [Panicum hallii var. hallii]|uniref:Uncharacterized protein n=1 Tax=Panicum hallii var. hallii TaxID=1504633 RepID=A0A2T7CKD0_9POAL|nr:hypothetical protein GQ55_8G036000 [Panicum hallii var. hallii]
MGACLSTSGGRRRRPSPRWSDLPPEIGGLVLCRLLSHVDRLSFGAVCRRWRLAARRHRHRLPPALPWLSWSTPPSRADCPSPVRGKLLPRGLMEPGALPAPVLTACFCSLDGWLMCEYYGASTTARALVKASSGAATKLPPPSHRRLDGGADPHGGTTAAVVSTTSLKRKMTMAPPSSPEGWGYSRGHGPWYEDVAFHRGKLYALTAGEELFALEVAGGEIAGESRDERVISTGPPSPPTPAADPQERPTNMRYLVASSCGGKLLMVKWSVPRRVSESTAAKITRRRIKMRVFEADLAAGRWLEVRSLGADEALFVSRGCSRALRLTGGDRRFQGNRVYFLGIDLAACCKEALWPGCGRRGLLELPSYGFYDLGSRRSSPVFLDGFKSVVQLSSAMLSSEWCFPCPQE